MEKFKINLDPKRYYEKAKVNAFSVNNNLVRNIEELSIEEKILQNISLMVFDITEEISDEFKIYTSYSQPNSPCIVDKIKSSNKIKA